MRETTTQPIKFEVTINYANGGIYKVIFDDIGNAAEYALASREIGEDDGNPCTTSISELPIEEFSFTNNRASRELLGLK
jgi:hypothetical protein